MYTATVVSWNVKLVTAIYSTWDVHEIIKYITAENIHSGLQ